MSGRSSSGEAAAPESEPAASKRRRAGGRCEDCDKVTANYALVAGGKKRWCGGCGAKHGAVMAHVMARVTARSWRGHGTARHPHSPAHGGSPRPAAAESEAEKPKTESEAKKPKAESEAAKRRRKQEPAKAKRGVGVDKVDPRSAPPPQAGKLRAMSSKMGPAMAQPRAHKWVDPRGRKPASQGKLCVDCGVR